MNGKETTTKNPLEGSIVYGHLENRHITKVDSIYSEKLGQNIKDLLKTTVENISKNTNFPEKPMKIGDSFDQKIPMNIPMTGIGQISFVVNTNYILKEIKNNIAYFDTIIDFILNSDTNDFDLKTDGRGNGKVEFDIKNKITTLNTSKHNLLMNIKKEGIMISATADSETSYITKVTKKP